MLSQVLTSTEFPAELEFLGEIMRFLRGGLKAAHLSSSREFKFELACEEAIVNIIRHAYPPGEPGRVLINCRIKREGVEVELVDGGRPFNPIEHELQPPLTAPIEERPIGGLGIFLIQQFADEVIYTRRCGLNRLQIRIYAKEGSL